MNNSDVNITVNYTYCSAELYEFKDAYANFHGYASLIVCQFGCIANLLNIAVLSRREMRSPTNAILTGLAVADLLVMLDYIPYACHTHLTPDTRADTDRYSYGWAIFVLFHSLFTQVGHTISICLTVILAVWRYVAVAYPQKNRDWCNMQNTILALFLSYILCPIICIPLYLSVSIDSNQVYLDEAGHKIKDANLTMNTTTLYYVRFNELALANDELFKKVNFCIYSVVIKLIPCIALTVLSMRLIFALLETKRRRQQLMSAPLAMQVKGSEENGALVDGSVEKVKAARKQKKNVRLLDKERQTDRTTRMLLAVLLLFLLTEFPQGILGLLCAVLEEQFFLQCYIPLGDVMDIIALINSAINFILYCSMSRQFRTTFKLVFWPKMCNRWVPVAQGPSEGNGHSTQVTQKRKLLPMADVNRINI